MWSFKKKQQEVKDYYQATAGNNMWMVWLLSAITFVATILIVLGLFWAGRWVYQKATNSDKDQPATTETNQPSEQTEQPSGDQPSQDSGQQPSGGNNGGSNTPTTPTPTPAPSTPPSTTPQTGPSELVQTGPSSDE